MATLVELWRKPRGFVIDVLPTLLFLLVLFAAGLAPMSRLPGPEFRFVDKVWHLAAFAALAGLLTRTLAHWGRPLARATRDGALVSAAFGALLEILQSMTGFRSAELADLIADALGALLAYALLRRLA